MLSEQQMDDLLQIPDLKIWHELRQYPLDDVLRYFDKFFVTPASRHLDLSASTLCDSGCGVGWLSFAFLLRGGKAAVLVDADPAQLALAMKIAEVLRLADRCTFHCCRLQDIPLADKSVDLFTSVETLEHVGAGNVAACVDKINRVTRRVVIVTAPNWLFPIDNHTTGRPFVHWLPRRLRERFNVAALAKHHEFRERFRQMEGSHPASEAGVPPTVDIEAAEPPKPWTLAAHLTDFRPVSTALTFPSVADWKAAFPVLFPYPGQGRRDHPSRAQSLVLSVLSATLGRWSFFLNWNLSALWLVRGADVR